MSQTARTLSVQRRRYAETPRKGIAEAAVARENHVVAGIGYRVLAGSRQAFGAIQSSRRERGASGGAQRRRIPKFDGAAGFGYTAQRRLGIVEIAASSEVKLTIDKRTSDRPVRTIKTASRGADVARNPMLNKGTAFSSEERQALGLEGSLPFRAKNQTQQAERIYEQVQAQPDDLQKYLLLSALLNRNAHLFYSVLRDHLEELMPIVYTPTVGTAVQRFSRVFQGGGGVWITPDMKGRMADVLRRSSASATFVCSSSRTTSRSSGSATKARAAWRSRWASSRCTRRRPASIPRARCR